MFLEEILVFTHTPSPIEKIQSSLYNKTQAIIAETIRSTTEQVTKIPIRRPPIGNEQKIKRNYPVSKFTDIILAINQVCLRRKFQVENRVGRITNTNHGRS